MSTLDATYMLLSFFFFTTIHIIKTRVAYNRIDSQHLEHIIIIHFFYCVPPQPFIFCLCSPKISPHKLIKQITYSRDDLSDARTCGAAGGGGTVVAER